MTSAERWQQAVGGVWHGLLTCWAADGRLLGRIEAHRRISREDGRIVLRVTTALHDFADAGWAARLRFCGDGDLFEVRHDGDLRRYLGPDCHGIGLPFGTCTIGRDHQVPWGRENRVIVLLHPDGATQTYTNLMAAGPRLDVVAGGIYLRTELDWEDDAAARARVAEHLAGEREAGTRSILEPVRGEEIWRGTLDVHDGEQRPRGACEAVFTRRPLGARRDAWEYVLRGGLDLRLRADVARDGSTCVAEGPDLHGTAVAWGRALHGVHDLAGAPARLETLEFAASPARRSVCWQIFRGLRLEHVVHGVLERA